MTTPEFIAWPKISLLANEHMTITEKIDGTNACIQIIKNEFDQYSIYAQSRTRLITPANDNYGFAKWVNTHFHSLVPDLGEGVHFGEWWGQGIQRNYGMTEKRFSLFNTFRWDAARGHFKTPGLDVVPLLHEGPRFCPDTIDGVHEQLIRGGSRAAHGFMKPEGVVVYLAEARVSYKITDAAAGPSKPRLETE